MSSGGEKSVSLGGVIDVHQIELLFNQLLQRVQIQDKTIRELRAEVRGLRDWKQAFGSLEARTLDQFQDAKSSIKNIEGKLRAVEALVPVVRDCSTEIKACQQELRQKPDREVVMEMNQMSLDDLDQKLVDMESRKADKDSISKFERVHESLCKQLIAMEGMINCKIDRSLLPMLEGSTAKMLDIVNDTKRLEGSIETVSNQVSSLEGKIISLAKEKEDKITMVRRMQTLDRRLASKLDKKELESVNKEVGRLSRWSKNLVASNEARMLNLENFAEKLSSNVNELSSLTTLESKASACAQKKIFSELKALNAKSNHHMENISRFLKQETRLKILEEQSGSSSKIQSAYLSDLRRQMNEVKQSQTKLSNQLQVAMRFVNWFTDVKLAGIDG